MPWPTDLIRTPDQRLRVFVSSTLGELAPERAAVGRAIEALALIPVMFELGARPYPPRELYRAYLAQSDIFVGLYWQRYGWVGPDGWPRSGRLHHSPQAPSPWASVCSCLLYTSPSPRDS